MRRNLAAFILVLAAASPAFAVYTLDTLANFNGTDGSAPWGGLTVSGNTFYGTTSSGGANNSGEVYSLPAAGGTPTVLASCAPSEGVGPIAPAIVSGSTVYAATSTGGALSDYGTIISVPITGGSFTVLATFNFTDGANPNGMILSGNTFYGTTSGGGAHDDGVVFSLPINGGTPTVLTSFDGTDGESPTSGLIISGNTLYGTTGSGGADNSGEVFSISTSAVNGTPTVLTSFNDTDGDAAEGPLILSGSTLYGETGGPSFGKVFSLPVAGAPAPTVLATFNGTDGWEPLGGMLLMGNLLYGTTEEAGPNAAGNIFYLPVTGGTPTSIFTFNNTDGTYPLGTLIANANGDLFDTTRAGGTSNDGTVFELVPEPSSASLLALGSVYLFRRKRRLA